MECLLTPWCLCWRARAGEANCPGPRQGSSTPACEAAPGSTSEARSLHTAGSTTDDTDIETMCDRLTAVLEESFSHAARQRDPPAPLLRDTSFQELPRGQPFGSYLHLVEVQTPLSPRETPLPQ
ncbi:uncharacterized protein LOC134535149 [Bacillus rossius redtenbacheri]|uniref:uncharacterized protein LOC134535149 n=1 Tax=Bacillus rossius redtenbacheri TaxID=93214 RepID=UPI002FDCD2C1